MRLQFDHLFSGSSWKRNWVLEVDGEGIIRAAAAGSPADADVRRVAGIALPGFVNVHSHAFQRALAGFTEYRRDRYDSFWTWRHQMYRLVSRLTPSSCYVIARQLYLEMIRAGYTTVGEFHYVHRNTEGHPYEDPLAMSDALIRAALETGIRICLLPVLYQQSGFGEVAVQGAQHRFALRSDDYRQLIQAGADRWRHSPHVRLGLAAHSLRAVHANTIAEVFPELATNLDGPPVHLHVAEQLQEVEQCIRVHHRRPVELLFDTCDVDQRWCLIHATHLADREMQGIIERQAAVGLCPTTEANLGDGFFAAREFCEQGGTLSIGSDSQMSVDPRAELRWLEYGQRLRHRARNLLMTTNQSTGRWLCGRTWEGGRQALQMPIGRLEVGDAADIVVLDSQHASLANRDGDRWLDSLVFCEHGPLIQRVFIGGVERWPVDPEQANSITADYVGCMAGLGLG